MRGGRNKFGPMYKRDRAKKLQRLRHHGPGHSPGGGGNGKLLFVFILKLETYLANAQMITLFHVKMTL